MKNMIKVFNWKTTWQGARICHKNDTALNQHHLTLPSTIDSMREKQLKQLVELKELDGWFIVKPDGAYNRSIISRIYHAYLVLFNKAGAWQYTSDHLHMAQRRGMYEFVESENDNEDEYST